MDDERESDELEEGFHEVDEFGEDMEPLDGMGLEDDKEEDPDDRFH